MAVGMLAFGWKKILVIENPAKRLRLDVLDVVDRGREAALVDRGDALADFLRRQPE